MIGSLLLLVGIGGLALLALSAGDGSSGGRAINLEAIGSLIMMAIAGGVCLRAGLDRRRQNQEAEQQFLAGKHQSIDIIGSLVSQP